jgi:tRNA U34 5-methylaminomethyl-2-thiouridine-forming methyltransferase MnmC
MADDNIRIITTEDGSHSLYNKELNETYHSFHGAVQESKHVFIKSALEYLLGKGLTEISVFEVGFGTGLNALLTADWAHTNETYVDYDSIEAFPVSHKQAAELNYVSLIKGENIKDWFSTLHQKPWDEQHKINNFFTCRKIHNSLKEYALPRDRYDAIFFDAFAPNKQSEMWELDILTKIYRSMRGDGVFVTYCAQGQLKRNLRSLGLKVETLQGPPGKKEMVRAVKKV